MLREEPARHPADDAQTFPSFRRAAFRPSRDVIRSSAVYRHKEPLALCRSIRFVRQRATPDHGNRQGAMAVRETVRVRGVSVKRLTALHAADEVLLRIKAKKSCSPLRGRNGRRTSLPARDLATTKG